MRIEARFEQHELAVARHQEIDHLPIAVARGDPLAHQQPQIARQRRIGIVDRLVLAHHAAQLTRELPRARLLVRIGHDLVGLHGVSGLASDHQERCKQQGERRFQWLTPLPAMHATVWPVLARRRASAGQTARACRRTPSARAPTRSAAPAAYDRCAPRSRLPYRYRRARYKAGWLRASAVPPPWSRIPEPGNCASMAPSR